MTTTHIAIAIAVKRKRILDAFRQARATTASRACSPEQLAVSPDGMLKSLEQQGVVKRMPDGRLWLDEEALRESEARTGRVVLIVASVLVAAIAAAAIIALTRR